MALMYFAKFNINSEIYKVYDDQELKDKILDQIFLKVDQQKLINDGRYIVKFCNLEKSSDNRFIAGRIVKIFPGEIERYNRQHDSVDIDEAENCASQITFYFDLKSEIIAFIRRRDFGYKQFTDYFKQLMELYFEDEIKFEIFLLKNIDDLKEKVYGFNKILNINVSVIPPNANHDDFRVLFGTDADEFKESNATKYEQTLSSSGKNSPGLNPRTKFFDRMFFGVGKGYGEMTVEGLDSSGDSYSITSDVDAPYKRPIPNSEKHSISSIIEKGKKYILEILSKQLRSDSDENKK